MRENLDLKQTKYDANAWAGLRPPEEVEQIVVMVRLELYNQGLPCGPKALHKRLDVHENLKPLPSEQTIARMLVHNGLTYGRTGWYDGDDPEWLPMSAKCRHLKNRGGMNI